MLALALLLQVEAAPPAGLELRWQAPAGCPDRAAVTAMVAGLLRPGEVEAEATVVDARVRRSGSGWELRLSLASARGRDQRTVRSSDCQTLARTAALVIAIHLDPMAVTRTLGAALPGEVPAPPVLPPTDGEVVVPPAPMEVPVPATTPGPAPVVTDAESDPALPIDLPEWPAPAASEPRAVELSEGAASSAPRRVPLVHVRVDGGLDVGVLPGPGGHAGLFAGASWRFVRLEAGVVGVPLRILPAEGDRPGGRFDRLVGAVRVCPTWRPRPAVALAACAGVEVGAIRGRGLGVDVPNPVWAPWLGITLGPAVRWRVAGPLGLWFAVDGQLALTQPSFTVHRDAYPVFQAGRGGMRATFGLDLQFGPRKR